MAEPRQAWKAKDVRRKLGLDYLASQGRARDFFPIRQIGFVCAATVPQLCVIHMQTTYNLSGYPGRIDVI